MLFKKILTKNAFSRGVGILVGGAVGAQALMVIASPLLTRLYSPEDFGLLAVYASILSFFIVIASLRYEIAIPLPEKEEVAIHLVILSLCLVCLMTGVSVLLVLLLGHWIAELVSSPNMINFLWLIPVGVFIIGFYQVFNYWAIRTKAFGNIAKTQVSQSLVTLGIQLSGFKLGVISLMVGQTSGQAIGVIRLARPVLKNGHFKSWTWKDVKGAAVRYKNYPLFSTWNGFLNTASMQLPPLLFAIFFSATAAGLYALAHRILAMPMSIIGGAVGNVFFANAAEAYREGDLAVLFESVYGKLVAIIMPITFVLIIDSPRLFSFIFGSAWADAGELARWMAPWLAVVFVASPLSVLFDILEKQKAGMCFQGLVLIVRIIAIVIGYVQDNMTLAIILFSFSSMICWIFFLLWAAESSKSKCCQLIPPLMKSIFYAFLSTISLLVVSVCGLGFIYWCASLLLTLICVLFYYGYIFRLLPFALGRDQ